MKLPIILIIWKFSGFYNAGGCLYGGAFKESNVRRRY
jgi:hypothetical protein